VKAVEAAGPEPARTPKRRNAPTPAPDLRLPTDRPRLPRPGERRETVVRRLDAAGGASPTQALAAFATLLYRYTGE
jgi:hypothetical protein